MTRDEWLGCAMNGARTTIGRLAMRQEGDFWNAYYALRETMDGALLVGSIVMGAITNNPKHKEIFLSLMVSVVSDLIKHETGHMPTWGEPETAPEHERAGSA